MRLWYFLVVYALLLCAELHASPVGLVSVNSTALDCAEETCPPETGLTAPPLPSGEGLLLERPPSDSLARIRDICFGADAKKECSFVIVKPNSVRRGLVGEVQVRLERKGLELIALNIRQPTVALVEQHYAHLRHLPFFRSVVESMAAGPVALAVVRGEAAVRQVRALAGPTSPADGRPGELRFDYGSSLQDNVLHAADTVENAQVEMGLWF